MTWINLSNKVTQGTTYDRGALNPIIVMVILAFLRISPATSFAEPSASIPQPLTAEWVKDEIQAHDAKYVIKLLWNENKYDELMDTIGSGKSEWIKLAPELASGTDAGSSEELGISLAYALPKNPNAVLSVLDTKMYPISPQRVCSAPFIEDTVKDIPAYIKQSMKILQKVGDPHLAKPKADCLAELEKAYKQIIK